MSKFDRIPMNTSPTWRKDGLAVYNFYIMQYPLAIHLLIACVGRLSKGTSGYCTGKYF
jgi:hypothetical protein